MKIRIINGPNLNLLGSRETDIYGDSGFETYLNELKEKFPQHELSYYQSNVEGELINALHQTDVDAFLLNAGGYTHTSVAIGDAVKGIQLPVVEVHISNVMQRETFRHVSYISSGAVGVISGFGLDGYRLGIASLAE